MKANEVPEKVYLDSRKAWQKTFYDYFTIKTKKNDIEYIRTDAFIEKAKKWFEEYNEWFDLDGVRHCDLEDFEDFKNYMEGE